MGLFQPLMKRLVLVMMLVRWSVIRERFQLPLVVTESNRYYGTRNCTDPSTALFLLFRDQKLHGQLQQYSFEYWIAVFSV